MSKPVEKGLTYSSVFSHAMDNPDSYYYTTAEELCGKVIKTAILGNNGLVLTTEGDGLYIVQGHTTGYYAVECYGILARHKEKEENV